MRVDSENVHSDYVIFMHTNLNLWSQIYSATTNPLYLIYLFKLNYSTYTQRLLFYMALEVDYFDLDVLWIELGG